MSIYRNSKQSLIDYINATNSSPLTVNDVTFGVPAPIAGTWREGLVDRNTVIRIKATEASIYKDSQVLCYDRLDLASLAKLHDFRIKSYQPDSIHDLIKPIFLKFGIVIDKADVYDDPINQIEGQDNHFTIRAKPDALGWVGSVDLVSNHGAAVLGDHLTTTALPGVNYPLPGDGATGSALMYFYGYDCTANKDLLQSFNDGDILSAANAAAFLTMINTMDTGSGKGLWSFDPASAFKWIMAGAQVVYTGLNDPALPTNPSYKYVIGIQIAAGAGAGTTPQGVFYLHFNDPVDPDSV
jgi:hypothetical protein